MFLLVMIMQVYLYLQGSVVLHHSLIIKDQEYQSELRLVSNIYQKSYKGLAFCEPFFLFFLNISSPFLWGILWLTSKTLCIFHPGSRGVTKNIEACIIYISDLCNNLAKFHSRTFNKVIVILIVIRNFFPTR